MFELFVSFRFNRSTLNSSKQSVKLFIFCVKVQIYQKLLKMMQTSFLLLKRIDVTTGREPHFNRASRSTGFEIIHVRENDYSGPSNAPSERLQKKTTKAKPRTPSRLSQPSGNQRPNDRGLCTYAYDCVSQKSAQTLHPPGDHSTSLHGAFRAATVPLSRSGSHFRKAFFLLGGKK